MSKEEQKIVYDFTPDVLYFATYMAVSDRRLFFNEWKRICKIVEEKNYAEEVYKKIIAIVRDLDEKEDFDDIVSNISMESVSVRETALCLGLEIARSDGTINDIEQEIFNQVRTKWSISKARFEDIKRRVKLNIEECYNSNEYNCFANEIFNQKQYEEICMDMDFIAKEDINHAMIVVNSAVKQLKAYPGVIKKQVDKVAKSSINFQETEQKKEMQGFLSQLATMVAQVIEEANDSLNGLQKKQKEISNHFTISFMGRTKAGKSTIHSILLGDINSDFIGRGMERTTRYNYIYDYNGIRIIDTPGIGAPNGQTDTEIAKEVADESDLICYVVTSDSIQETEFSFLQHLKEKNKPVIILLNKKENFARSKKTKEKFLANPLDWYNKQGEDAIQGHIDRINEYVQKKFDYHNYSIIPVQLLAAKMACVENDDEIKEKLLVGSRIAIFIETLFDMICDCGTLQKSQTIYNSSIYYLEKNNKLFNLQSLSLKEIKGEFEKHSKNCVEKIDKVTKKTRNEIINSINVVLDYFVAQDVRQFAYQHYDKKKEDVEKAWKKLLVEGKIEKQIQDKYEQIWNTYMQSIEEIIQETEENMEFSVEFGKLSKISLGNIFDIKATVEITGSVIGLIGAIVVFANPLVGGVMIAVSIITAVAGLFMKSKQKRIEESKEKLYTSLKDNMKVIRENVLKDILKQYDSLSVGINKNIKNSFELINKSLSKVDENLMLLQTEQQTFINKLNCLYAVRIANYMIATPLYSIEDEKTFSSLIVERDYGKQIVLRDDKLYIAERKNELDKMSEILQEEVVIKEGD